MRVVTLSVGLCLALTGCAYKAEPVSSPAYNLVTSYTEKIPGKYLLFVEADALTQDIKTSDFNCAAHHFPLSLTSGFKGSVIQTLNGLFGEIEVVDSPVPVADLGKHGARGIVVVRGESINPNLRVVPGFWTASMESRFSIVASAYVDKRSGRVYGSSFEGNHTATTNAGAFCSGGSQALSEASQGAMKEVVRRIAEGISNSDRVRRR